MAYNHTPYRFKVYGIDFDVTFVQLNVKLEYGSMKPIHFVTLAFARKIGTTETLAAKAIQNPRDPRSWDVGHRVAFKRLLSFIYTQWYYLPGNRGIQLDQFVSEGRKIAFLAGMWNEVEE